MPSLKFYYLNGNPMKILSLTLGILLGITSVSSIAKPNPPFYFFIQGIYSSTVTINRASQLFGELTHPLAQPITFKTGPTIDKIEAAINTQELDVLFWGYSDKLNDFMKRNGYEHILSSYLPMHLYQFENGPQTMSDTPKIGVLVDSTALYSAELFYAKQNIKPEIVEFDNYFVMMQACFRKELDFILAARTFIIPQPEAIQKKFAEVQRLPSQARASFWIKASASDIVKHAFVQYINEKKTILANTFGTDEFLKPDF